MLLAIFAFATVLFFLYGIHQFVIDKFRYHLPPGPRPLPFLGNLLVFSDPVKKPWEIASDIGKTKYGGIWTCYYGQYRIVSLHRNDLIQEALVQKAKTFSDRPDKFLPGFKNLPLGVVSESGHIWNQLRRFTLAALRDFGMGKNLMATKIQDEVDIFLAHLGSFKSDPFEPHKLLENSVSNVICSLVFGKRYQRDDTAYQRLEQFFHTPFDQNPVYFAVPLLRFISTPYFVRQMKGIQEVAGQLMLDAIKEHRQSFHFSEIRDFPDMFIQSEFAKETAFDDFDSFIATMVDMYLAGTQTTSAALNWTLLYLAKWPEIQQRCHVAIDKVIGTTRLPMLADRPNLVYIDAVMCEVLRFATIVPSALFHTNGKVASSIAGYDIPPWTIVSYSIWDVHHDKDYWIDPENFRPERWLDEKGKLLNHNSHFMPFGIGPRICLGEQLARMEYFIFIVSLLHRFNFSLDASSRDVDVKAGKSSPTHVPPNFKLVAQKRF